jgi:PAS domain S-box-containing protein
MQQDIPKPNRIESYSTPKNLSISLRLLLVLPFVLQIGVAVGLVGWLSLRNGKAAVETLAHQVIDKSQRLVNQHLNTYLAEPHRINQLNAEAIQLGELNLNDFDRSGRHFWKQSQSFNVGYIGGAIPTGEFSGAGRWINGQGTTIDERSARLGYRNYTYATDGEGHKTKTVKIYGYNPKEENWYPAALKAGKPVWSTVYNWSDTPEIVSIDAGHPVYDSQHKLIAILDVSLLLSHISEFLREETVSLGEKVLIMERNGNLIASSSNEQPFEMVNGKAERLSVFKSQDPMIRSTGNFLRHRFKSLDQISAKQSLEFTFKGRRQFLSVSQWKDKLGLDWLVVITVPESDFMAQIQSNTYLTTLLCLGTLVGSTLLGWLASRWVTQPIRRLNQASRAIAEGNLHQTIPTSPIRDLNDLAQSFNGMAYKLRHSFDQLESRVQERTQSLQETEALLQRQLSAVEAASEGIAVLNNHRFIYLNPAHLSLFGYDALDELMGHSWTVLYSPQEVQRFEQEISPILLAQGYWQGEMLAQRRDGTTFAEEISLTFAQNGDLICISRDITERKLTQVRLEASKESAEKANRAKSQFLANMSHELRTPLNAIIGFTQLMSRDISLRGENQEFVEIINQSGEHLLGLINDILEMSKIEAGLVAFTENRFDLYRLLKSVEALFKLKTESKGLQLIFVRAENVPQYIETDEIKLRQILINLLGNAVKFTPSGQIRVSVSVAEADELENDVLKDDEPFRLCFEVEDTGAGIAESELNQLFQPFVQTTTGLKSQQGTGLGLAISRKFVQLMGGDLAVRSEVGLGTSFTFSIGTRCAAMNAIAPHLSSLRAMGLAPGQPSYRILVVDDKLNNRRLLVNLLSLLGFQVREAVNGLEAISIWENWAPHLILMDMRMPEMNGYEATRQIKAHPKGMSVPIIALTASALHEERHEMIAAGCDDCVYKPFREEELMAALVKHLHVALIYEQPPNVEPDVASTLGVELTAAAIAFVMDEAWIQALQTAAKSCDDDQIYPLIAQIPPEYTHLTEGLTQLTEEFAFDQIVKLTRCELGLLM